VADIGVGDIGKVVACPKCGERGRVTVERFQKGVRRYYYLVVRHPAGRSRFRRCWLRRLSENEVSFLKPRETVSELISETVSENEQLRKEVERLKTENEELKAKVERLERALRACQSKLKVRQLVEEGELQAKRLLGRP